jgi:hypothetical protein
LREQYDAVLSGADSIPPAKKQIYIGSGGCQSCTCEAGARRKKKRIARKKLLSANRRKVSALYVLGSHSFYDIFGQHWHEHYCAPRSSAYKDEFKWQEHKIERAHGFVLLIPPTQAAFFPGSIAANVARRA